MPSSLTSEELEAWFEDHANYNFNISRMASAHQVQCAALCQQLHLYESGQTLTPRLPLNQQDVGLLFVETLQTRVAPSVSSFTLSDDARALPISPENQLSEESLINQEREKMWSDYMAYLQSTQQPLNHCAHLEPANTSQGEDHTTATTVQRWLDQIPPSTEKRSSLMYPLSAGFTNQNTLPTTDAIDAYQSEHEQAVTEREFFRRQKHRLVVNRHEGRLGDEKLIEVYLEDGELEPKITNKTKKWCPPWEEELWGIQREDQPKKVHRCPGKNREDRKRSRFTVKAKGKLVRQVTGAQWVALGESRQQM